LGEKNSTKGYFSPDSVIAADKLSLISTNHTNDIYAEKDKAYKKPKKFMI
jgi:hypothetical protein